MLERDNGEKPEGMVTDDELRGPDLKPARWALARLPLPSGEHTPLDPNAEVVVRDGERSDMSRALQCLHFPAICI